jgi:hypothetical protein
VTEARDRRSDIQAAVRDNEQELAKYKVNVFMLARGKGVWKITLGRRPVIREKGAICKIVAAKK